MTLHTALLRLLPAASLACLLALVIPAAGADWPCWRGPDHDNTSQETGWRTDWKTNPPTLLWKATLGWKWGCPIVADGRIFVLGEDYLQGRSGKQTLHAFDAETGKELWKHESAVRGYNNQPLTYSPAVDGDFVYFYTASASLKCLRADTGKVVWEQDLTKTMRARREVKYGYRCSPVVWKDRVMVPVRVYPPKEAPQQIGPNLAAFDKTSGKLLWANIQPSVLLKGRDPLGANWHTPTPAVINDRPTLIFNTGTAIVGVDMADGRTLWEWHVPADEKVLRNKPEPGVCGVSPVVVNDVVVFNYWSAHMGGHTYALRIKGDLSIERLWMSDDLVGWKFICTTAYKGAVFGCNQPGVHLIGAFTCIDLATGKKTWSQDKAGCGFTIVDGKLLIWDGSRVHLAEASSAGYRELGVSPALPVAPESKDTKPQNGSQHSGQMIPPILSNGRLYCRSVSGELFCLDVRKKAKP